MKYTRKCKSVRNMGKVYSVSTIFFPLLIYHFMRFFWLSSWNYFLVLGNLLLGNSSSETWLSAVFYCVPSSLPQRNLLFLGIRHFWKWRSCLPDGQKLFWKVLTQLSIAGKIHINAIVAHRTWSLCTFHDFQLNARALNIVMWSNVCISAQNEFA